MTSIRVHQCAVNGELHCLAAPYVSLCFYLGHAMPQFTDIIGLSEPQLAELTRKCNYPLRFTRPKHFTGPPRQPETYLVSLNSYHTDGLITQMDGGLRLFPSDSAVRPSHGLCMHPCTNMKSNLNQVSPFVLTEENAYVQEKFMGKYQAIELVLARSKNENWISKGKSTSREHSPSKQKLLCPNQPVKAQNGI